MKLLFDKGKLLKVFTQNIDCLEREAGLPGDMMVEAHGSFASQRCIECQTEHPDDLMRKAIMAKSVPRCLRKSCNGLVKPDIVFFGEALPESFHRNRSLPAEADLAIIMGTSLTVQPFASLPSFVREQTPRILINLERVGGLGGRADDVLLLGDCDDGVRKLADALGWREELEELWKKTTPSEEVRKEQEAPRKTRDEKLEDEVEKLTQDIDKSLKVSEEHTTWLKEHLADKHRVQRKTKLDEAVPPAASAASLPPVEGKSSPEAEKLSVNGDAPSSQKKGESGNGGGIKHVYPHIDEKAPDKDEKPEKPSL